MWFTNVNDINFSNTSFKLFFTGYILQPSANQPNLIGRAASLHHWAHISRDLWVVTNKTIVSVRFLSYATFCYCWQQSFGMLNTQSQMKHSSASLNTYGGTISLGSYVRILLNLFKNLTAFFFQWKMVCSSTTRYLWWLYRLWDLSIGSIFWRCS